MKLVTSGEHGLRLRRQQFDGDFSVLLCGQLQTKDHLLCHIEHLGVVQAAVTAEDDEGVPPSDHTTSGAVSKGYGRPHRPGLVGEVEHLIAVAQHVKLIFIDFSWNPEKLTVPYVKKIKVIFIDTSTGFIKMTGSSNHDLQ